MTVKVQWWGGPDDGLVIEVADGVRDVEMLFPPKLDFSRPNDHPNQPIEFKTVRLPIMIRKGRAYLIYPKTPPKEET